MKFERRELDEATAIVRRHVPPTPQYSWPMLDQVAGSQVIVKHENHTPVGAFKVRGGLVYMDRLVNERPEVVGVVSATRGNHGQSLAFAGGQVGRSVTIVVPRGNSVEKNAAMRALGAEVVEFGVDFQEARERSLEVAAERGLEPVPPFHRDLVLGVATYALELFEGSAPLDTVYVPVGMGSGINALIAVRDLLGLDTEDRRRRGGGCAVDAAVVRAWCRGDDRVGRDVRRRGRHPVTRPGGDRRRPGRGRTDHRRHGRRRS